MPEEIGYPCERPWGHYIKFYQEEGVWVKRIEVKPHSRLSLQKHQHRSEKWIVVKGRGSAVVFDQTIPLSKGVIVDVPLGALHRLCNDTDTPLIIIEVATGDELTENDIERIQDDYAR